MSSAFELVLGSTIIIAIIIGALILFVREYSKRVAAHTDVLKRKEQEKQAALLDATIDAQEGERARIGSDIHDDIGPLLSTLKLYVDRIKVISDAEERNNYIDSLGSEMDNIISEIRRVAKDLVPVVLIEFGLEAALENLCDRISQIDGINASVLFAESIPILSKKEQLAIYRICQEFCNNSIKYAEASNINIRLSSNPFALVIQDDGKGFSLSAVEKRKHRGLGLKNMTARAHAIESEFEIISIPNKGTKGILKFNSDDRKS